MMSIITNFKEISSNYRAVFCDLWGCLHNGKQSFSLALNALASFKQNGGLVVLVTNAPRPKKSVANFIERLGITLNYYDDIVTSGDAAQLSLFLGQYGKKIYHIGPLRDSSFFEIEKSLLENPITLDFVDINNSSCIVCTGLFDDDIETPDDYKEMIEVGVKLGLELLCVNPDIQVDYGDRRLWCAGAIARDYEKAGGKAHYFGKPHRPIYNLAFEKLKKLDPGIEKNDIICIGDGIKTDIYGGNLYGLDTLFVCGGLSDIETGIVNGATSPDKTKLISFLEQTEVSPTASIGYFK